MMDIVFELFDPINRYKCERTVLKIDFLNVMIIIVKKLYFWLTIF